MTALPGLCYGSKKYSQYAVIPHPPPPDAVTPQWPYKYPPPSTVTADGMDAANPSSPTLPPTPHMGTVPLPDEQDTVYIGMDALLTPRLPVSVDFSAPAPSLFPWDAVLDSRPATAPPVTIHVWSHQIHSVLHFHLSARPTSVWDVLAGIHALLHEPASEEQLRRPDISGATAWFMQRVMRIPDANARWSEYQRGIKLVDILQGAHTFAGLVESDQGPYSWELLLR